DRGGPSPGGTPGGGGDDLARIVFRRSEGIVVDDAELKAPAGGDVEAHVRAPALFGGGRRVLDRKAHRDAVRQIPGQGVRDLAPGEGPLAAVKPDQRARCKAQARVAVGDEADRSLIAVRLKTEVKPEML